MPSGQRRKSRFLISMSFLHSKAKPNQSPCAPTMSPLMEFGYWKFATGDRRLIQQRLTAINAVSCRRDKGALFNARKSQAFFSGMEMAGRPADWLISEHSSGFAEKLSSDLREASSGRDQLVCATRVWARTKSTTNGPREFLGDRGHDRACNTLCVKSGLTC